MNARAPVNLSWAWRPIEAPTKLKLITNVKKPPTRSLWLEMCQRSDLVLLSKLGGMLATERPILVTTDEGTELHHTLTDVAIIVPPGDAAALASGILAATVYQPDFERIREVAGHFSRDRNLPELTKAMLH